MAGSKPATDDERRRPDGNAIVRKIDYLDAVGGVGRGEHGRALRRLIDGLRPEHADGGQRHPGRRGAREEGELVGVGVERAVQEHVGGAGGERAQHVARDGRARELEPPGAAHQAHRHPWRRRRRKG